MKTEITTDLKNATFEAKREFEADVTKVWKAWTESHLLNQWWAPKPWKCETKSMDFRPGGKWIYEMVGPNGERHGGIQIFNEIKENEYFSGKDAFLGEDGEINEDLPVATWSNTFTPTEEGTIVKTTAIYPTKEALETILNMGISEGLNMAQDGLEELLRKEKSSTSAKLRSA